MVLHFLREVYAPKKVILYRLSIGTILSKSILNTDTAISGAILDSFVVDPTLVVDRIFEIKNKHVLLPDREQAYIESNREPSSTPILLFSGLKDIVTKSTDHSEFISLEARSRLVTWDCNHLECLYKMTKDTDSDLYISEVNTYVYSLMQVKRHYYLLFCFKHTCAKSNTNDLKGFRRNKSIIIHWLSRKDY